MAISPQQRSGIGASRQGRNRNGYSFNGTLASDPNEVIPKKQQQYTDSATGSVGETTFPPDLPTAHMNFLQATAEVRNGIGKLTPDRMYRLPVPMQTADTHRIVYNDGYSYAGAILGGAQKISTPGRSDTIDKVTNAVGFLGKVLGYTINTYKGVALEQPQFKTHQLSWKLSPKTSDESIIIQRIITGMRGASAPNDATEGAKFILEFPKVFIPWFHPNTSYMYKFKPCVMTALDVDYQGGNPQPSFFKGDKMPPESVIINMSLLEMEYWLRRDFEKLDGNGIPNDDPFAAWNHYYIGVRPARNPSPNQ